MIGKATSQRIEYLSVIGGFLDGLRITFRGDLNCVIGARGTGKTTAVEFVGYALDALPHREHAADERKRIENLVKRNLNGGRIEIGIRATDGTAYRVTRSFGDDPIVLDETGAPAAVSLKSGLFRAEIYSQNAVESIADRPLFQLDLIDSLSGQQVFIPGQTTLKHDGTGFGLPTAKRYIEAHGGSLEIDSQEGVGTRVSLRLPLAEE